MIEKKKEKQHVPGATTFPFGGSTTPRPAIVFMGTPEFAVASLAKLIQDGHNIIAVITAPDKPGGRGMELQQSAVKKFALSHGLRLLQPDKLKDASFIADLRSLKASLQVVVAFRMLPEVVWNMPSMGTINLHGSLLPQYRGAAPINWAIINGEKFTGITTFKLQHEIDTGNILMQERLEIGENETAGELHDKMKEAGAALLSKTVKGIETESLKEFPQDHALDTEKDKLFQAPRIFSETCKINWMQDANTIHNLIRGLSPYPTASTELQNKKLKIFSASKIYKTPGESAKSFETDHQSYLHFKCQDGYIDVLDLQLEGKKRMGIREFLRGYRF